MSSVPKKSSKSFAVFVLRLIYFSCDVKNMQKIATSTGHYVTRLDPRNDIKLLVNVYKTSKIDRNNMEQRKIIDTLETYQHPQA